MHVDAAVREESVILRGQHGIDHRARYLGEPHRAVVLVRRVPGARQHLGLEHGGPDVRAVTGDAGDALGGHVEAHALGGRATRAAVACVEIDFPGAGTAAELARGSRRATRLDVAQPAERPGQIDGADVHAGREGLPRRVQIGRPPCLRVAEARQLDTGVDDEPEDREGDDYGEDDGHERPRPHELHCARTVE